ESGLDFANSSLLLQEPTLDFEKPDRSRHGRGLIFSTGQSPSSVPELNRVNKHPVVHFRHCFNLYLTQQIVSPTPSMQPQNADFSMSPRKSFSPNVRRRTP